MVLNNDYELLKLNLDLIHSLNRDEIQNIDFLLVDNSKCMPKDCMEFISSFGSNIKIIEGYDFDPNQPAPGSSHHGKALNLAVSNSEKYEYLIVTEPDFYVLQSNWIRNFIQIMDDKNYPIFGAAAHPKNNQKIKDFPGPRFFISNLHLFPIHKLDWTWGSDKIAETNSARSLSIINKVADYFPNGLRKIIHRRFNQQISVDTGIKIYEAFFKDYFFNYKKIELLKCLVKTKEISSGHISYSINKFLDIMLPKKYNLFHKTSYKIFNEINFSDSFMSYERYVLNNNILVAFHRRGSVNPTGLCSEAKEIINQAKAGRKIFNKK